MLFRGNSFFTPTEDEKNLLRERSKVARPQRRLESLVDANDKLSHVASVIEEALDALEVEDTDTLTNRLHAIRDAVNGVSPH